LKISNFEFRISNLLFRGSCRGAIYPILLINIAVIGVATAALAQLWSVQVQREKEEELLFRLGEFRRAIQTYRTDHNRLPKELGDLLQDRSRLQVRRYLRKIYTDPMTGKADWQLKLVTDRTGAVSGIQDLNSRSTGKPFRQLAGKKADSYKDW
jgi:type II secretory pathway pseudopilin PulG